MSEPWYDGDVRGALILTLVSAAGCDLVFGLDSRVPQDGSTDAPDALLDAHPTFGSPEAVTLTCPAGREPGDVTLDRAEMVFVYSCAGTKTPDSDLYEAPRATATTGGGAMPIAATAANEGSPELGPDGLSLYFVILDVARSSKLNFSTRPMFGAEWVLPAEVTQLNTIGDERPGSPDATGDYLVISRGGALVEHHREGGVWSTLSSTSTLGPVLTPVNPHLSADGLTLVFAYPDGNADLYISRRGAVGSAWAPAAPIAELNTAADESAPWLSADQRRLYFSRDGFVKLARK